jgi:hypothetical protein
MPYTPTVQDRTGEFLMRGITGAADSLAQGIKDYRQNKQEHGGLVTLVEDKVKTSPGLVEKYGDKLAKAPAMSLSQLKALNSTLDLELQNQRLAQEQANKEQDYKLREAYLAMQQGQLDRSNQRDAAGQRFTQTLAALADGGGAPSMDFANTLAGEPMPARDLGLADIVQAAGRSGMAMDPASLAQLIRAENLDRRPGLAVDPTPVPFSAGGLTGVFSPKTGQFQVERPEPVAKDPTISVVLEADELGRPVRTFRGTPEQYEKQFGKPLSGAGDKPDPGPLLEQARQAIQRGAKREAVLQRLKDMGVDTANLKL